jgi:hypothetical protein
MADSKGTDEAFGCIILLIILAAIGAAVGGGASAAVDNEPPAPPPGQHAPRFTEPPEDVCPDGCEGY